MMYNRGENTNRWREMTSKIRTVAQKLKDVRGGDDRHTNANRCAEKRRKVLTVVQKIEAWNVWTEVAITQHVNRSWENATKMLTLAQK